MKQIINNVLSLSIENQNHVNNVSIFDAIKHDNRKYAEEAEMDLVEYLLLDYDSSPENWNNCFEFSYDEISAKAKEERRNIVERIINY